MALQEYDNKAFVAFVDISGFKSMMFNNIDKAGEALDEFFQAGYDLLYKHKSEENRVQGIFVSDCGIILVECKNNFDSQKLALSKLLNVIKDLNIEMLKKEIMLTTSIAYGHFTYKEKIEFPNISKNGFLSYAYLAAYLDSEDKANKLKPGMCRIVLEKGIKNDRNSESMDIKRIINELKNKFVLKEKSNKIYFYWNLNNKNQIKDFNQEYKDAENMVYQSELEALKKYFENGVEKL